MALRMWCWSMRCQRLASKPGNVQSKTKAAVEKRSKVLNFKSAIGLFFVCTKRNGVRLSNNLTIVAIENEGVTILKKKEEKKRARQWEVSKGNILARLLVEESRLPQNR